MKYYVISDVHGYYTIMINALRKAGYFADDQPHKLVICGDLCDRGGEAKELERFVLGLMASDEVILIKGNHEDLMQELVDEWDGGSYMQRHHISNGTVDTALQLTDCSYAELDYRPQVVYRRLTNTQTYGKIIGACVNYFETKKYIFVHGWLPCTVVKSAEGEQYFYRTDWRQAEERSWAQARWINGMDAFACGANKTGKTVVCGHFSAAYGHCVFNKAGREYGTDDVYTPFYGDGIIALDGCTAVSGIVNCVVIEDEL